MVKVVAACGHSVSVAVPPSIRGIGPKGQANITQARLSLCPECRQAAANMEIVREYVTNPEFRQALHDYTFEVTYKP